jgi:hypothetical protein
MALSFLSKSEFAMGTFFFSSPYSNLCGIALSRPSIPHLAAFSALFGVVLIFSRVPWFLRGVLAEQASSPPIVPLWDRLYR